MSAVPEMCQKGQVQRLHLSNITYSPVAMHSNRPPKRNKTDLNDLNDFIFHSPGAKKKNVRRHFGTTGRIASTEGSATTAGRRACVTRGKGTKPTTLLAAGDGFVWTVPIVRTTAPLWTRVTI